MLTAPMKTPATPPAPALRRSAGTRGDGASTEPSAGSGVSHPTLAAPPGRREASIPAPHAPALHPMAPPIARASMVPESWSANPFSRRDEAGNTGGPRADGRAREASPPRAARARVAQRRRRAVAALVAVPTGACAWLLAIALPFAAMPVLSAIALALFVVILAWLWLDAWTVLFGFGRLRRGPDPRGIEATTPRDLALDAAVRVAVVMPICNEDVARAYAGLQATFESVAAEGLLAHFDFYILSDSTREDVRAAEVLGWVRLQGAAGAAGHLYYRHRRTPRGHKSGNVADFCRRWGRRYRYMAMLDADSVMSGACLRRLTQIMEAHPDIGMLQTDAHFAGCPTLYGRMQQFGDSAYRALYDAGARFWQLGESHYWGHNALIRVAPFMRHCALRRIPGRGPFSGEILSHDSVEAALMRRAGWGVWLTYPSPGSYEGYPLSLPEKLRRDRRWFRGDLMNLRLCAIPGLHPVHRLLFLGNVMGYLGSVVWAAFLLALTVLALRGGAASGVPWQAGLLLGITVGLLVLRKLLALALGFTGQSTTRQRDGRRFAASVACEALTMALLAPLQVLFHARVLVLAALGVGWRWTSPLRSGAQLGWRTALACHGIDVAVGFAWLALLWALRLDLWPWTVPVAVALLASLPLCVYTSRPALGRTTRRWGLFLTPEEREVPPVLRAFARHLAADASVPPAATVDAMRSDSEVSAARAS
ncbi:MAG TPA: glucans biosynthesis glucosyltransferase MdoH [Nevskiaceae bacterium]